MYKSVLDFILFATALSVTTASHRSRVISHLNRKKREIADIKNQLSNLHTNLLELRKRTCAFGINSHHCALANLNDVMASKEWLGSAFSPGKRASTGGKDLSTAVRSLLDRMEDVETAHNEFNKIDEELHRRRRTCRLNLGGNCGTSEMSAIADYMGSLRSPFSPGRRRRSVTDKREGTR